MLPDRLREPDDPAQVPELLRGVAGDFVDLVLDLGASAGCELVDARTSGRYLDMTGFYASAPLGLNHPGLWLEDPTYRAELDAAARHKPSNPDFPTVAQARFVETFRRVLGDDELPYLFFVEGGALAVENALKVAFDWKARHNAERGRTAGEWRVSHLEHAFHGRSGYTLSLTNTDPVKTWGFPAFAWPRIPSPEVKDDALWDLPGLLPEEQEALEAAEAAFRRYPHQIACAIVEPIQCEGGDRHLRAAFLRALEDLCHSQDALFVVDEVQTGCGVTGRPWAYQALGLTPDLVAFGKKTQVCGVMGGRKVLETPDNAFRARGRISSTWGGNLVDMVRATRILEIVEAENLMANAVAGGELLLAGLRDCALRYPRAMSAPRGRGLLAAVDFADSALRDQAVRVARERHHALFLGCGDRTLRLRPPLSVTAVELQEALRRLQEAVADLSESSGVAAGASV